MKRLRAKHPLTDRQHATDAELIRVVAKDRDEGAFSELYRRHEQAAYTLARHMLHQTDSAEVAVQEAMLRLWHSADRYRYDKNARGWILRIVAFECIRIQKAQRTQSARTESIQDDLPATRATEQDNAPMLAHQEMLDGLRHCMERLPQASRKLVAMYYLGGLTQEEIGRELEIPQATVSNRLAAVLKSLKAELGQMGFAASLPLLSDDSLGTALGQIYAAPESLQTRVLDTLARPMPNPATKASASMSRKIAAGPFAKAAFIALFAATLAVAAGTLHWILNDWAGPSADNLDTPSGLPHQDVEAAATTPPALHRYSFDEGMPPTFRILDGSIAWHEISSPFQGVLRSEPSGSLEIPHELDARPWRIRVRYAATPTRKEPNWSCSINPNQDGSGTAWHRRVTYDAAPGKPLEFVLTMYLVDGRYAFLFEKDTLVHVSVFNHASKTKPTITMKNVVVDEIDMKSMAIDEIPEDIREPERFIRTLESRTEKVQLRLAE